MRCIATILIPLMLTTGCAVTGKWSLASIEPEAARRDFEFASLTLQKDGSFYAESQSTVVSQTQVQTEQGASFYAEAKESGIRTASGTYTFKDGTLNLKSHGGVQVPYDATFLDANHLRLEKFWQGRKVKAKFDRIE
jgi:hypothetical protein